MIYFTSSSASIQAQLTLSYGAGNCTTPTTIVSSVVTLVGAAGGQQTSAIFPSSNITVPSGSVFCLGLTKTSGTNGYVLQYDSAATPTNLNSSDTIFIPERLLVLLVLALLAPLAPRVRRLC